MSAETQRVIWTLLPNGVNAATGNLKFSVLVSPRLTYSGPPERLAAFPDWLDWPALVRTAVFDLSVDGGPPHRLTPTSSPKSAVWTALFTGATAVTPYKFTDLRGKTILSYPVAGLAKRISDLYTELAAQGDQGLPPVRRYERWFGIGGEQRAFKTILSQLGDPAGATALRQPGGEFDLLAAYHRPLNAEKIGRHKKTGPADPREDAQWRAHKRTKLPDPSTYKDQIDVHQIASSLVQFPGLAREAGIVLEFEADRSLIPDGTHVLRLTPRWTPGGALGVATLPDASPPSMVRRLGARFEMLPRSAASPVTGRWLKLSSSGFDLVQMDVDGAGLKVKNFAGSLPRIRKSDYDDESFHDETPAQAGAPSLRSAGLMLAQERLDLAVQKLFAGNGGLNDQLEGGGALPAIWAEDSIRGWRVDIKDEAAGEWRSICRRDVDFTLLNTGASGQLADEEGAVRLAAGSSTDGSNPQVLKIHEGLFAWKGWSLCAPEPFAMLKTKLDPGADPDDPKNLVAPSSGDAPPPGLPLKTAFSARGLPTLRFGKAYRVRVRLVDLAGASEPVSKGDIHPADAVAKAATRYLRHEPVEPPALALVGTPPHDLTSAQAAAAGLIAEGEAMARAAIRTFNETPALNTVVIPDRALRHAAPPRTTLRFAEAHGVLDDPSGRPDPAIFPALAAQDDPLAEVVVASPGAAPTDPPVKTTYAVARAGFALPYLPDPYALGCAIRIEGVPGVDPKVIHRVPFYGDGWDGSFDAMAKPSWPKGRPFTVVGAETIATPHFDPATREFRVPLPKAARARLKMSAIVPRWALAHFAVREMIAALPAARRAELEAAMGEGRHWMVTPERTLELVHAVQRPLVRPHFDDLYASRNLGALAAQVGFVTPLNAASTGRLDLEATWHEPTDDGSAPGDQARAGHAFELKVARNETPDGRYRLRQHEHVFPDTRYRRVTYRLDAASRYREYMPDPIRNAPERMQVSSDTAVRYIENSAPPPAPQVLYAVPTFGWTRTAGADTKTSVRTGGLRVYLARPWFATGYGEMLGVVLPPPGASADDLAGRLKTHVTQWGSDPIWVNSPLKSAAPALSAFPLAQKGGPVAYPGAPGLSAEDHDLGPDPFPLSGLPTPDGADLALGVAPHVVGFDAERGLWYADIVVRAPASQYFPFIRLALARYHPRSASGAHLSNVALAEFLQITPDRMVVVTHAPGGLKADVAVYGAASPADPAQGFPEAGLFDIKIQVRDAGADPDLGWRTVAAMDPPHPPPGGFGVQSQLAVQPPAFAGAAGGPAPILADQVERARSLVEAGDYRAVLRDPGLILALRPPLIYSETLWLPAPPAGGARRLLITESEVFQTDESRTHFGRRVVFAETVEV